MGATRRDPWFDNAKLVLICLVVIGHAWVLLRDNTAEGWLYHFLYAWHMPAFALITGYFSRSFTWAPRRLWRLVTTVAVPYVVFEWALATFQSQVGGVHFSDLWIDPHWPMWYLSALFFWRLMTPVFKRIPAPVFVAVLLSLSVGFWGSETLDFYRVFGMLPFFVLGLTLHRGHWELLGSPRARVQAVAVLGTIFGLAAVLHGVISQDWLYYSHGYADLGSHAVQAVTIRTVLLLVGAAGALAFLALVPRRRLWISAMGASTLVVYLFHGFFVKAVSFTDFPGWTAGHPVLALVLVTAGALALALTLARPPVAQRLQLLVDPVGSASAWWRNRHDRGAAGPALPEAVPVPAAAGTGDARSLHTGVVPGM